MNRLKQFVKDQKIRSYTRSLPLKGELAANGYVELVPIEDEELILESKLDLAIQSSTELSRHFSDAGIGAAIHFNDILLYYPNLVSILTII